MLVKKKNMKTAFQKCACLILLSVLFIFSGCVSGQPGTPNSPETDNTKLPLKAVLRVQAVNGSEFSGQAYSTPDLKRVISFDVEKALTPFFEKKFREVFIGIETYTPSMKSNEDIFIDIVVNDYFISNAPAKNPYLATSAEIDYSIVIRDSTNKRVLSKSFLGWGKKEFTLAKSVTNLLEVSGDLILTLGTLGVINAPLNEAALIGDFITALVRACEGSFGDFQNSLLISPEIRQYAKMIEEKNTSPSQLVVDTDFNDNDSLLPNNRIDSGEASTITAIIRNEGKGTAFDVKLAMESQNSHVHFPAVHPVGDVLPGKSIRIDIPVTAALSLETGTTSFLVNAREKRGYNARPVELQISTSAMKKPDLIFVSCYLNDASGLGKGDGDNLPENNETIELTPYLRNAGMGPGLQVDVELKGVTPGIEIVKGKDRLDVIEPNSHGKASLAFRVPRTFSGSEIKYDVVVKDARGLGTSKTYSHTFRSKAPQLGIAYRVVDRYNREIAGLENGESYVLRITPGNSGSNAAEDVKLRVSTGSAGVDVGRFSETVGGLDPESRGSVIAVPVTLSRSFAGRVLELDVEMTQDSFPDFNQRISLPVSVTRPRLDYQVVLLNGVSENSFTENASPRLRVSVSNRGGLDAEQVGISLRSAYPGIAIDATQMLGTIKPGASQFRDFTFRVLGGVKPGKMPINVRVTQSDFNSLEKTAFFKIVQQAARVKKIKGTGVSGFTTRVAYTGPPQIHINSPNNDSEIFKKTLNLHGSIIYFGTGNDIADLQIWVNGRRLKVVSVSGDMPRDTDLITRKKIEGDKLVFDGEVSLRPEMNDIKITCRDRNGLASSETIRVHKKDKLGNIYAVVVGISNFADSSYNLNYAASDAIKFDEFLKSKPGGSLTRNRVKLITDHEATRAGIISALTRFAGKAVKEDTVEIYMATHGVLGDDGELYYASYDTDIKNLFGTGFSNSDFEKIVKDRIRAGRVIIYLDVCHAGRAGLSDNLYARRNIDMLEFNRKINTLAAQFSKTASGVATVSASRSTEYSKEGKEWDGGLFTYCLLKGLKGEANENDDEWISLDELDDYLSRQVFINSDGAQKPKVNSTLNGKKTFLSKVK